MQKRAGLLYLSLSTRRILLILENQKWTVPTFVRNNNLYEDGRPVLDDFNDGKIIPIELYLSKDKGFEYNTYICLTKHEFLTDCVKTLCWCDMDDLPKNIHTGLRATLSNNLIRTKIETILELQEGEV